MIITNTLDIFFMCIFLYTLYYTKTTTNEVIFSRWLFWVQITLCYLQNWMFCPITSFQVVRFEQFLHKQGSYFWDDCFEYQQCYVIFKIEHFIPYFCLSQYYLLCVYISHIFYFSSAILIVLNDILELTVLCTLRDFFKDKIDVFLLTVIGQFPFLLWTPFFFKNFFTCIPDICSWATNYIFLQLLPSQIFINLQVSKWGQFLGGEKSTLDPDPYLGCNFLTLI